MKKTLEILSLLFAGIVSFTPLCSCSDDDDNDYETVITESQLPSAAKTFLSTYYPDVKVARAEMDYEKGVVFYDVRLQNGHEVTFNADGEWMEVDAPDGQSIPDGFFPAGIVSYLQQNYSGYGVNDITKIGAGYEVELVSNIDLIFDAQGNFIRVDH